MSSYSESELGPYDAIAKSLKARRSCRAFLSEPVPRTHLERIFDTAKHTASWCNAQPWHTWMLEGKALEHLRNGLLARFDAGAEQQPDISWPREYLGKYRDRRRESGLELYRSVGIERTDREATTRQARENFRFFGAPHVAIVTTEETLGAYGVLDCGAWVHNVMLVAQALGIASIAQASPASHATWLREQLRIDDTRQIVCSIALGYAEHDHPVNNFRTSRATSAETLTWLANEPAASTQDLL